jgi:REP element-mobilizing transposase RayT
MPRGPRLDVSGSLHHVMVRGLERRVIFRDDRDRREFLTRLAKVHERTGLEIFAWALLPNHFHLLVQSPHSDCEVRVRPGLTTAMRQLLTGYAGGFNRRHHRTGPLVQGRFKSILVEEDPYLLELVRYIHLNPLRAGIVLDLRALDQYLWTGHSVLMGHVNRPWQAAAEILVHFGASPRRARMHLREFMAAGVKRGTRPELQGGGLRRSAGGWEIVPQLRRGREQWASDERVLGSGSFVEQILQEAEPLTGSRSTHEAIEAFPYVATNCATLCGVDAEEILGGSRRRSAATARAILSYLAVGHLGLSAATVARRLGVTPAVVLRGTARGLEALRARCVEPRVLLPVQGRKYK